MLSHHKALDIRHSPNELAQYSQLQKD